MELVNVTITGQAITARYGTLNPGDVLRTDATFARHLVEECSAAKYSNVKSAAVSADKTTPIESAKTARLKKIP